MDQFLPSTKCYAHPLEVIRPVDQVPNQPSNSYIFRSRLSDCANRQLTNNRTSGCGEEGRAAVAGTLSERNSPAGCLSVTLHSAPD